MASQTSDVREACLKETAADRRCWPRLSVNWSIRLFRIDDAPPIYSTVENISSGGLFFFSSTGLIDGELVRCEIALPDEVARPLGNTVSLECDLKVLRSEAQNGEKYGIACEMRAYSVRTGNDETAAHLRHS